MTDPLIPTELPESSRLDEQLTWTVRGEEWARVRKHQWGVDVELEVDGSLVAVFPPDKAYAVGLALLAAAQGPNLPRDAGDRWGGGSWRRPGE